MTEKELKEWVGKDCPTQKQIDAMLWALSVSLDLRNGFLKHLHQQVRDVNKVMQET